MRAFRSTLEDLDEKRSIHSFHSLHSIRSSRSHQGTRPLAEECSNPDHNAKTAATDQNSSNHNFSSRDRNKPPKKSQSLENVPLVPTKDIAVVPEMVITTNTTRTISSPTESENKLHETSI